VSEKRQDELARVLGASPPPGLKKLAAADRKALAALVEHALDRHRAAIEEAEVGLLRRLPRPLRPAVRSLLRDGG
jgi:hypothetical protein